MNWLRVLLQVLCSAGIFSAYATSISARYTSNKTRDSLSMMKKQNNTRALSVNGLHKTGYISIDLLKHFEHEIMSSYDPHDFPAKEKHDSDLDHDYIDTSLYFSKNG